MRYTDIYNQDEGFLTKLKNRLVCGEMLYKLAKELGFGEYIIISKHIDENCDGRNNKNIIEDTFEAFIGALYLDTKNMHIVKDFLIKVYESYVDFSDIILNDTNYKDQIIRYLKQSFNEHPKYVHEKINDKYFCNIVFKNDVICRGEGSSKKRSEQDVSKKALIYYNVLT